MSVIKVFADSFLMAPMAGVTDEAFRARLRRNGCRAMWTEMVSAAALVRSHRASIRMISPPDQDDDLVIQIFGAKPDELGHAASILADKGWIRLDLNMGCPVRKVVSSGAGSALMRDPALAARCVGAARRGFTGILTVKMRIGWSEETPNFLEIGRIAAAEGADGLILHGRTKTQGYSGEARWEPIYELAEAVPLPVAGNGDVGNPSEAVARLGNGRLAAVMIGRQALKTPWIFRDASALLNGASPPDPPSRENIAEDLGMQFSMLLEMKGPRVAVAEMKKFLAWSDHGSPGSAQRRNRIMTARTPEDILREIEPDLPK